MVGLTLREHNAKFINQSKSKCCGCFKKLLISTIILIKQQEKIYSI